MGILKVRKKVTPKLLEDPNVVGIGNVGNTLRVYVQNNPTDNIPYTMDGYNVEVVKVGKIVALPLLNTVYEVNPYGVGEYETLTGEYEVRAPRAGIPRMIPKVSVDPLRTTRHRPVPGGVSIGHPLITAGTNGVSLRFLGIPYGISNNHVLAACSSKQTPRASIGDPTYQPGPYDGGRAEDTVGNLMNYVPIDENGPNRFDVAVWSPHDINMLDDEIMDLGVPRGVVVANTIGQILTKSGRTTGVSSAPVVDLNATLAVNYGAFEAVFENQIMTENMADGGDSGSAVLDENMNMVGLLFAGSDYVTVHNHIGGILQWLNAGTLPGRAGLRSAILPILVGALIL